MDDWYMLLNAAITGDRKACEAYSLKLGYITGQESPVRYNPGTRRSDLIHSLSFS